MYEVLKFPMSVQNDVSHQGVTRIIDLPDLFLLARNAQLYATDEQSRSPNRYSSRRESFTPRQVKKLSSAYKQTKALEGYHKVGFWKPINIYLINLSIILNFVLDCDQVDFGI